MEKAIVKKIKEKKEFSELSGNIVERILDLRKIKNLDNISKVKETRAILRKIFTAFLTNKILKGKISGEEILKKHISTKHRDYEVLYERILDGKEQTILDLGAGVNGFSYPYILKQIKIKYIAVEAVGQLVKLMNDYFKKKGFDAKAIHGDLFDINKVLKVLKNSRKPRAVFVFNVIDALEFLERDFSKKLILAIGNECEKIVLSFPTQSLSGKTRFKVKRYWILNFINENFKILDEFELKGERFVVFKKVHKSL